MAKSDGAMFAWLDSSAGCNDRACAIERRANQPIAEIAQNKGAWEVHPLFSPSQGELVGGYAAPVGQ